MSDTSPHEEAQLLARVTVLELVLGMMVRDSMLKSGKGPQDILGFGEIVKKLLEAGRPRGQPTNNFAKPPTGSSRGSLRMSEAWTRSKPRQGRLDSRMDLENKDKEARGDGRGIAKQTPRERALA